MVDAKEGDGFLKVPSIILWVSFLHFIVHPLNRRVHILGTCLSGTVKGIMEGRKEEREIQSCSCSLTCVEVGSGAQAPGGLGL